MKKNKLIHTYQYSMLGSVARGRRIIFFYEGSEEQVSYL